MAKVVQIASSNDEYFHYFYVLLSDGRIFSRYRNEWTEISTQEFKDKHQEGLTSWGGQG